MADARAISAFLEKKLATLKRDGAPAVEAAQWLTKAGLLARDKMPEKRLRAFLRAGKIRGAYQFPNKRWVIINRSRLPDGIQRVVPLKEAAETLHISERAIRQHVEAGSLKPLNFGPATLLFLEEEITKFYRNILNRTFRLLFPKDEKELGLGDIDKLRRQLYYLRSDIRLIAERIEELIRLLE